MLVDSGLQAAAAIAAGAAIAHIAARRIRVPVPLILLAFGFALGTDGLGVVKPDELGGLLELTVVLAVALIVFEGGTALNWRLLRVMGPVVRNLVIGGLVITPAVGMLASHFLLDFPWRVAVLFGAIVCVTGPSVITPLLQAVKVNERVSITMMGEGIIIDPLGALLTLFLLQIAVSDSIDPTGPTGWLVSRIGTGIVAGAVGALVVFLVPRVVRRLSSRDMALLTVGAAVATFATAESLAHESGLTSMVVMGVALGNLPLPHRESLVEFQDQTVAFLVSAVYVLLAAEIRIADVRDVLPEALLLVLVLAVVGRPLLVFIATFGTTVTNRERIFIAAVGPRGVVAAALAGAVAVEASGHLGVDEARFTATVFVVIASTIAVQSAYAGPLSRWLRVFPMTTVIAGAGEVGRRLAARLVAAGEAVLLIDSDEAAVMRAREEGFETLFGDAGSADVLRTAGVADARAFIATMPNDDRALLAAQLASTQFGCKRVFSRVDDASNYPLFEGAGISVINPNDAIAAEMADVLLESTAVDTLSSTTEDLRTARITVTNPDLQTTIERCVQLRGTVVVLVRRGGRGFLPTGKTLLQLGDQLTVFGPAAELARVRRALSASATVSA